MEGRTGAVVLMLEDEVALQAARLPELAQRNTKAFFDKHMLDRRTIEGLVLRTWPSDVHLFYVSTVARGLAGSRSDLDFIIIGKADLGQSTLSSMLFHLERRIGVKYFTETQVELSLTTMAAICEGAAQSAEKPGVDKNLPIGWADLERIVHGHSARAGISYAHHLKTICAWAIEVFTRQFSEASVMASVAATGGLEDAARGYALKASIAAMDLVMAAHGHVQSNWKWTHERWKRFKLTMPPVAQQLARVIDDFEAAAGSSCTPAKIVDQLEEVAERIGVVTAKTCLVAAVGVDEVVQLGSARALVGAGRLAIVPQNLLKEVVGEETRSLSRPAAALAVDLVGTGLLRMSMWGHNAQR